ncbi:hypothetical protein [Sneathiella chinensis]|nr:hypothetical protein [Sneathiella chinensis]
MDDMPGMPGSATTKQIVVNKGDVVPLDVSAPDNADFITSGQDLIITVEANRVVLKGFAGMADLPDPPSLQFQDGKAYSAVDVLKWTAEFKGIDFMSDSQDDLVDLDALFDMLNIAVRDGVDALDYVADAAGNGGVLIVRNDALAESGVSSSLDDLGGPISDLVDDPYKADES